MTKSGMLDLGTVEVHKNVLAAIVHGAVREVKGVRLEEKGAFLKMQQMLLGDPYPSVIIHVDKEKKVGLDISITVEFGMNIPDTAREVQNMVRAAMEKALSIQLKNIHVNVQGIEGGVR